jgi:hypothetical protein
MLRRPQLEFLQVNVLIIVTLVEIELVAGTAPNNPVVRLCAMASPTICYWIAFIFCGSAILTHLRWRLPFNMSSTPKGSPWRPALFAFIEDAGAIEGQGGTEYRRQMMKRYEVSPRFRRMVLIMTWFWGLGLLIIAIVSTVVIMVVETDVGFGIGWGLPFVWAGALTLVTIIYTKKEVADEKHEWLTKTQSIRPMEPV